MMKMLSRNGIAKIIVILCLLAVMVSCCFGGTQAFESFVGGRVISMMINPVAILLAGGFSTVLLVNSDPATAVPPKAHPAPTQRALRIPGRILNTLSCGLGRGEPNLDAFSAGFILLPLVIFTVLTSMSFFQRFASREIHSSGQHTGMNMSMKELKIDIVSNIIGVVSCYAMGFFFIPVARFSPILIALGWNPVSAVRIHVWAGTIAFLAAVVHGLMYIFAWKYVDDEPLMVLLFPSKDCFRQLFGQSSQTEHAMRNHTEDSSFNSSISNITITADSNSTSHSSASLCHRARNCSCMPRMVNFTGLLAILSMTIIALTSLTWIRRNYYAIFYRVHVTVSPFFFLIMAMHFRFVMIYMGGGMLYYLACTVPVWMEYYFKKPVQLVSIEEITSSENNSRPLISLTFAVTPAAKAQYRPGQYVSLLVPSISPISHPFTVNLLPDDALADDESPHSPLDITNGNSHHMICRMRIIFRATGPFTRSLCSKLTSAEADPMHTAIYLDGFHGPSNRVEEALSHDSLLIVGGGVGIVPYLSLLESLTTSQRLHNAEGSFLGDGILQAAPSLSIHVHWICRERQLVEYIRKETLNNLLSSSDGCKIQLVIHDTSESSTEYSSGDDSHSMSSGDNIDVRVHPQYSDSERTDSTTLSPEASRKMPEEALHINVAQAPFSTSIFATGSKSTWSGNLPNGLAFLGIGFVGLAMMVSSLLASFSSYNIFNVVWDMISLVLLSLIVSIAIIFGFRNSCCHNQKPSWSALNTESTPVDGDTRGTLTSENIGVLVDERFGRPDFCGILTDANFDDCHSPGVFFCGPEPMVESLKVSASKITNDRTAFYEETYLM